MRLARPRPPGRIPPARLGLFAAAGLLWAGWLAVNLYDLQVLRARSMLALARRQQEQVIPAEPRRGTIFDRAGRELAVSAEAYSVYAAPEEIQDPDAAARGLAAALGMPSDQIRRRLAGDGFVSLRRRVAPAAADRVRALKLAGVHLITESRRFYPRGNLAAHVLGFVVPDESRLREGLERRYDAEIRGAAGALVAHRDARGSHVLVEARREAVPGHDLITSLDEVIQHLAERELAAAIEETGARSGSVVVLHPPTGEILALANHPTFSPNRYGASDPASRRNRAVTDYYEPGSTFKIVMAAAAIEQGLVRPSEVIDCQQGLVHVAGVPIRDHKPFGLLSFAEVIAESSNVGAIKVGIRLDSRTFHEYASRFGFGARTGVDLPGESRGLLRPPSKWQATSTAYVSIGQEIAATPLQIASAFSAIANRGLLVPPRVVTRIVEADGLRLREASAGRPARAIQQATADVLIDLMEGAVRDGTGARAAVPSYRVAGKTGTAQKVVNGAYAPDRHVASFCGFVPSRRPVLTILVVLDEPRGALYHGGDVAAPVFSRIAGPALEYLGVPPDEAAVEPPQIALLGAGLVEGDEARVSLVDAAERRGGTERAGRASGRRKDPLLAAGARAGGDAGAPRAPRAPRAGTLIVRPVAPRPLRADGAPAGGAQGWVADAPPQTGLVAVPDLSGAPLRDAVAALARAGLAASIRGDGFVVAQAPAAGAAVSPGSAVAITLGRFVAEEAPPHDTR